MELAAALHHSAQRVEGPGEGEVHAMHDGLRAQMRPLPGTRPGLPPEPEPQVRAATVGYVAAPVPFLSAPLLADTAAEAVDARTVHFLLTDAVKHLKEGRKMEEEEERRWMAQVKAMTELSRQLPRKRKSKKRKKRKLPRAPLPRGGRPFALQRQVPTVQVVHVLEGAPASVHRQSAGFQCCATETWHPQCCCTEDRLVPSGTVLGQSRCARVVQRQLLRSLVQKTRGVSTGAVLGQGDMPVVILSDAYGQTAQKTVVVPQLEFFVAVDIPFVTQKLIPTVQTVQQIIEFVFGGRCPFCAGRANSQVLPWRRRSCSHSFSSLRNRRPLFPTTGALWFRLQKTVESPQLQSIKVVDFFFMVRRQMFMVLLFSRPQ